jgi:hypothetical protein
MVSGPFTSRNLTPDTTTGLPAGLTLAQFQQVMRTGVDPKQVAARSRTRKSKATGNGSSESTRLVFSFSRLADRCADCCR